MNKDKVPHSHLCDIHCICDCNHDYLTYNHNCNLITLIINVDEIYVFRSHRNRLPWPCNHPMPGLLRVTIRTMNYYTDHTTLYSNKLHHDMHYIIFGIKSKTSLLQACIDGNIEMVRFLVEHGIDINATDNEGWTALHATASCGYLDIARLVIYASVDFLPWVNWCNFSLNNPTRLKATPNILTFSHFVSYILAVVITFISGRIQDLKKI